MLRHQGGHSVAELLAVLSIISVFGSMASVAGFGWINSSRLSREASRLADYIAVTRQKAVAEEKHWRIKFASNPPSRVVHSYTLESCSASCNVDANWVAQADPLGPSQLNPIAAETGIALEPLMQSNPVSTLTFDQRGFFANADTVEVRVCPVETVDGQDECRTGSRVRLIRVRRLSGILEM